ncbi:MAG TPA: hypothetical protein VF245_02340 [Solirubrobacterales bacterium]
MKFVRTFGIGIVATAAVMAFVGTSSALANSKTIILCEAAELECENPRPEGTDIEAVSINFELKTSLGTVSCAEVHETTTPLYFFFELIYFRSHLLRYELLKCKLGKTSCTGTTNELGDVKFTKTGALTASAQLEGGTSFTIVCGSLINCKYGGEPVLAAHSSEAGVTKLLANEVTLVEEGEKFLCPDTSKLVATFTYKATVWIESP